MILGYYLDYTPAMFLSTIRQWPSDIYNPEPIIAAVQTKWRSNPDDKNLMEALAELYQFVDQPRDVVRFYMLLAKPETFEFIRRFRLFDVIQDDVYRFLELKSSSEEEQQSERKEPNTEGIALLIDHSHTISPETVLKQLKAHPYFQYCYIKALREREGGFLEDWGDLQVELYAAFNRTELLQFLKTSNTYNLEKARAICQEKDYVQELVFIYSRMGDNQRALTLIIDNLEDVEMAIDFVRGVGDEDLWNDLVEQAKYKPRLSWITTKLTCSVYQRIT
jgi:vacuolar protein sorting-associated protein 41